MSDLQIVVRFEQEEKGFTVGRDYPVLLIEGHKLLLVNDDARLVWVDPGVPTPVSVRRGGDPLFDLVAHRLLRKLDSLAGKPVVLTTWENLGFEPDEVTDESMLVYRGVVEVYDGQTLFLRRQDRDAGRFGVLPKAIASIEEES
jgi:hypothetical protein